VTISQLGESSAFLVLNLKEIVFSIQEDLAQQIEITVLNITGALILGIGVSTFAKYLATLPQKGSATSHLIPAAVFLPTISFFGSSLTVCHHDTNSVKPLMQLVGRKVAFFVSVYLCGYRAFYPYGC